MPRSKRNKVGRCSFYMGVMGVVSHIIPFSFLDQSLEEDQGTQECTYDRGEFYVQDCYVGSFWSVESRSKKMLTSTITVGYLTSETWEMSSLRLFAIYGKSVFTILGVASWYWLFPKAQREYSSDGELWWERLLVPHWRQSIFLGSTISPKCVLLYSIFYFPWLASAH